MKCEHCNERDATIHFHQNINGKVTEHHLCSECAIAAKADQENSGDADWMSAFGQGFGHSFDPVPFGGLFGKDLLSHFFQQTGPTMAPGAAGITGGQACPGCGSTAETFRRTGTLGCAQCYDFFRDDLVDLFRRLQRGPQHIGRKPGAKALEAGASTTTHSGSGIVIDTAKVDAAQAGTAKAGGAEAGAGAAVSTSPATPEAKQIAELKQQQAAAVAREDYMEAARLRDEIRAIQEKGGSEQ